MAISTICDQNFNPGVDNNEINNKPTEKNNSSISVNLAPHYKLNLIQQ